MRQILRAVGRVGDAYVRMRLLREFRAQSYLGPNERPVEFRFVFNHIARFAPRSVLDVGSGATPLPALLRTCGCVVTATDNVRDYWSSGMVNRHFHIVDDDIRHTRLTAGFDLITCISVLEHIREHEVAVAAMFSLLRASGHLVLTCPYNDGSYCPNVYELPGSCVAERYRFVTQAYSRKELNNWLSANRAELVEQEYWQFFTGEFWTVGEPVTPPRQVGALDLHQISCMLLKKIS